MFPNQNPGAKELTQRSYKLWTGQPLNSLPQKHALLCDCRSFILTSANINKPSKSH